MSIVAIRKFETDGFSWLDAEVTWDSANPGTPAAPVNVNYDVPGGGIASLTITPGTAPSPHFALKIIPEDVPDSDNFTLPISVSAPLPADLVGSTVPTGTYPAPYTIQALSDTNRGFRLFTGSSQ